MECIGSIDLKAIAKTMLTITETDYLFHVICICLYSLALQFIEVQPNDGFGTLLPQETLEIDLIFSVNKAKEYSFQLNCKSGINRSNFNLALCVNEMSCCIQYMDLMIYRTCISQFVMMGFNNSLHA